MTFSFAEKERDESQAERSVLAVQLESLQQRLEEQEQLAAEKQDIVHIIGVVSRLDEESKTNKKNIE